MQSRDTTPTTVLIEVGAAKDTDHERAVAGAAMFWGALRRVWDPSVGMALVVHVDGTAVRAGFEVTGDDAERVRRVATTIHSLARHTMPALTWKDGGSVPRPAGAHAPLDVVASFTVDRRREPIIARTPIGLRALTEVEGPWVLRLDLIAPLDGVRSDATPAEAAEGSDAEVMVSLELRGRPGPAGDAAAALLAFDLAGPVSLIPRWGQAAGPIELPAAALHHLLGIPGRMATMFPVVDAADAADLAELTRELSAPHMLLLGATGAGKSTALVHIAGDAMEHGEVVVAVDTHDGRMLEQVAARARMAHRPALMVRFGAAGGPVLDVTEIPAGMTEALWVENLWSLIRHDLWQHMPDTYFGPVGEKAIRTLLTLAVRVREFGLADVTRLLDPDAAQYRESMLRAAVGADVRIGVEREIMPMIKGGDNASLFVSGKFTPFSSGVFRDVTSGRGPRVPFEAALEQGVSLLVHAPSSRLGDIPARTLIAAALRRVWAHVTIRRGGRRVTIVLDEWQRYAAGSAITMLTESRKFGTRVVIANQVLTQLGSELRNAALGNVGAIAAYRVSPADASLLDGVYPTIPVRRLQTLPKHTLALTTFDADRILPGPAPVEPEVTVETFAAQLDRLGLDPARRRAELQRLDSALRARLVR